ncbi:MAG: type II toxin-antitoxin system RelE/ParE family toxin [Anaerolineae bacterium CG_4_9_14_0_8_um_filter_58_9]|nr:MAG: type II toxin-antitoxin system RelE/ParE family toxin [Anaerolineae bacterium CG_4_9_14_0_8_um_filter_58_9]
MYRFDFTAGAERELDHLDSLTRTRILKRLKRLGENADVIQHEELTGPLSDLFKLRVGDYRVLYDIIESENLILVHQIGHRSDVYRRK